MKIGLALGAGGANGLAHILMLEVLDDLNITPHCIAGTSIGAVIGALYASNNSAADIRAMVDSLVSDNADSATRSFLQNRVFKWLEFVDPNIGNGGLIKGDAFLAFLLNYIKVDHFEELEIPLKVVATDFWQREAVVLSKGELSPAIQGSMSIPGLFSPVKFDGKLLLDGGTVNPLPYDVLPDDCDLTIAINVAGKRSPKQDLSFIDSVFNTFQIMQHAIVVEKLRHNKPDIYIAPDILDIRALEFHKADSVYRQSEKARDELRAALDIALQKAK